MSKIHIALVGGQPAPVYHGIIATNPDKVIYVYSEEVENSLSALRAEINAVEAEQLQPLSPTNPIEIENVACYLAEKYKDDEIVVNISSGLKSWSHIFGYIFQERANAAVVYMDQNNVLWNYKTKESSSDFTFDMFTLFRLYGNPLERFAKFSDYSESDKEVAGQIEGIRKVNIRDFNKLLACPEDEFKSDLHNNRRGAFTLESGSCVKWEKPSKGRNDAVVKIYLQNRYGGDEVELESPHALELAFNSGWFEYKIASILSKWKSAKDICLNCRFPFDDKHDKNEVDIIINTGNKLLFVECKTQIYSSTDIDKFRAVVKKYGGMGAKALFVTYYAKKDMEKQKCEEHGIIEYSLEDGRDKLLQILNNELNKINA